LAGLRDGGWRPSSKKINQLTLTTHRGQAALEATMSERRDFPRQMYSLEGQIAAHPRRSCGQFQIVVAAVMLFLFAPHTSAHAGPMMARLFGYNKGTCVISNNYGGEISEFLRAADEVHKEHLQCVIEGVCESACVIFADKARPNVCIDRDANFDFHLVADWKMEYVGNKPIKKVVRYRFPTEQSDDIKKWLSMQAPLQVDRFVILDSSRADWLGLFHLCT
jgi:hypothetical protein